VNKNYKAFPVMVCDHCDEAESCDVARHPKFCARCVDFSRQEKFYCGRCEDREAIEDRELCKPCEDKIMSEIQRYWRMS
jgi:hypothetical protein